MFMLICNHKSTWNSEVQLHTELNFICSDFGTIMLLSLSLLEVCFLTQLPFSTILDEKQKAVSSSLMLYMKSKIMFSGLLICFSKQVDVKWNNLWGPPGTAFV